MTIDLGKSLFAAWLQFQPMLRYARCLDASRRYLASRKTPPSPSLAHQPRNPAAATGRSNEVQVSHHLLRPVTGHSTNNSSICRIEASLARAYRSADNDGPAGNSKQCALTNDRKMRMARVAFRSRATLGVSDTYACDHRSVARKSNPD